MPFVGNIPVPWSVCVVLSIVTVLTEASTSFEVVLHGHSRQTDDDYDSHLGQALLAGYAFTLLFKDIMSQLLKLLGAVL